MDCLWTKQLPFQLISSYLEIFYLKYFFFNILFWDRVIICAPICLSETDETYSRDGLLRCVEAVVLEARAGTRGSSLSSSNSVQSPVMQSVPPCDHPVKYFCAMLNIFLWPSWIFLSNKNVRIIQDSVAIEE